MIVRYSIKCSTCEQAHTLRIGMGQEESQTHKFPCRNCAEEIVVRMEIDYSKVAHREICVTNCVPIEEVESAPIVNIEASFLIPAADQGVDQVFPRITQIQAMGKAAKENGSLVNFSEIPRDLLGARPFLRANYSEEWKHLRKAWSLARNGRTKLSERKVAEGSAEYYSNEPLTGLPDWVFRFSSYMSQPGYEQPFTDVMNALRPLYGQSALQDFVPIYGGASQERGTRYFTVMRDFFSAYSEFGQAYLYATRNIRVPEHHTATSVDFEAVRMFYGNTYEHFTSLVDLFAMLNNMLSGRSYDTFQSLTLQEYRKLDKPARFGPFTSNGAFMSICSEADNHLRNASHHGSFVLDTVTQMITYHSGKGGTGPAQQISYSAYLERCVRLFLQILALFRVEALLSRQFGTRTPL